MVPPFKIIEEVHDFNPEYPHYSRKHRTVNADESCDHFSIAYHILCVLHGYEHGVVKHFMENDAAVLVDATDSSRRRTRGVFAVVLPPIRALLKPCFVVVLRRTRGVTIGRRGAVRTIDILSNVLAPTATSRCLRAAAAWQLVGQVALLGGGSISMETTEEFMRNARNAPRQWREMMAMARRRHSIVRS